jgi:hypothetical protein
MRVVVLILMVCSSNLLLAQQVTIPDTPNVLKEVTIKGIRNYHLDSLNRRKEYASIFDLKSPRFNDIFISKSTNAPLTYSRFQNSTSSLAGINVFSIINLLSRNKTPASKLQKVLLKEEANNYVDRKFSAERIQAITAMKGDSLQIFMNRYRPAVDQAKQMTDYELMMYIKKSHEEFIKSYKHEDLPSLMK